MKDQETVVLLSTKIAEAASNDYISEEGVFPTCGSSVEILNMHPGDRLIRVWCEQSMVYTGNGRNDTWNAVVELLEQAQTQNVPVAVPDVRGGTLTLHFFATIKDSSNRTRLVVGDEALIFTIVARQPTKPRVRTELDHKYLNALIYLLSAFEPFNANGEPAYEGGGFGLFRLKHPTVAELWNWKVSAETAKKDFERRKETADKIPEQLRTDEAVLYKGLPDFTTSQLELEALQSYTDGMYHKPEKSGFPKKWKWVTGATNDGFADECLGILADVAAGNPPLGWN